MGVQWQGDWHRRIRQMEKDNSWGRQLQRYVAEVLDSSFRKVVGLYLYLGLGKKMGRVKLFIFWAKDIAIIYFMC